MKDVHGFDLEARCRLVELDRAALGALFEEYFDLVWRYVFRCVSDRALAEDLTQDIFIKIHSSLHGYNPERPIKPWLMAVAANRVRDHWRSLHHKSSFSIDELDGLEPSAAPTRWSWSEELPATLLRAMSDLREETRVVVELRVFGELKFEEIGATLGIPPATARKRYSRGLGALRDFFEGYEVDQPSVPGSPGLGQG